jgi:hypothetical protein
MPRVRVYGILGCNSAYELMIPTIGSRRMDGWIRVITVSASQSQCHLPLRGCTNDMSVR